MHSGVKKINMLVLSDTFRVSGGAERFLLNFLKIFPQESYRIDLVLYDDCQDEAKMFDAIPGHINVLPFLKQLSRWTPELMEELIRSGKAKMADVRNFVHERNGSAEFKRHTVEFRTAENWRSLIEICPEYKGYDIAIAFRDALPLVIVAEKVQAAKKFVFAHTDYKTATTTYDYYKELFQAQKPYFGKMDGIVCVTDQNAESFRELLPSSADKVKALKNINDAQSLLEKAAAFYPPEYKKDAFNILTVARLDQHKGIELLLLAAYKLKTAYGIDFRWHVLGNRQSGSYSEKCHELREALGIEGEVVFWGERPNPFPYYKHCNLYVQTSVLEGRPLTIEEAMTLNCTIVTTNVGGIRDQIRDGINGRICAQNADDFAKTIFELYSDEKERERLASGNADYFGDAGAEEYLQYFS